MGVLRPDQALVFLSMICLLAQGSIRAQTLGQPHLVYAWERLDFDWPSEREREQSIANGSYQPERNLLAGIKVYKDEVYLTIPRWMWSTGHPVTLAKVVKVNGQTKLRPYPTWAAQKQGDCNALQYTQSMEVDPNTGLMYVIDTGRVGNTENLCPAKIVVYDLNTDREVQRYEMPSDVVSRTNNFLNDIVLDYVDGKVRYAYITNTYERRLTIYDFLTRSAHYLEDSSMEVEGGQGPIIHINGTDHNIPVAIDGIAMSPDFKYVYYCVLGGYNLYQVPTSSLRNHSSTSNAVVRLVGRKISQTDGMFYGSKHLYYGALGQNAVYYWDAEKDMAEQKVSMDRVTLNTQGLLVRDDIAMQWPDTFSFDERGWIWFVSNRLQDFRGVDLPATGDTYMRVWKVYVNETGYLYGADRRTQQENSGHKSQMFACSTNLYIHLFIVLTVSWLSK